MKKEYKKVIDFYNNTTNEQKCYLLLLMSKDIMVPVEYEDGVHCLGLDDEAPVCMNGAAFQINTENLYTKEK
jgi:hypothetical protein|tara:strand:- start:679 stop:894 length:216 start_codon:yes stop_codon:yes gene_type:complete